MFEYEGLTDPSRLLKQEISEKKVELRMHLVTGLPVGEIHMGVAVQQYSRANSRHPVSHNDLPSTPFACRRSDLTYVPTLLCFVLRPSGISFRSPPQPRTHEASMYLADHARVTARSFSKAATGAAPIPRGSRKRTEEASTASPSANGGPRKSAG